MQVLSMDFLKGNNMKKMLRLIIVSTLIFVASEVFADEPIGGFYGQVWIGDIPFLQKIASTSTAPVGMLILLDKLII